MPSRLKHFIGGAVGVLTFEIVMFARHPEAVQHHLDRFGVPGMVVASAALVLLAAITGLLTLAARPRSIAVAFLAGIIPPAVLTAVGLPEYGAQDPVTPSGRVLLIKPKPAEALWLPVSPMRHITDGTTASIRGREARVVADAVAQTEQRAHDYSRAAVRAGVAAALAAQAAEHRAELQVLQEQQHALNTASLEAAHAEHVLLVGALEKQVEHERAQARQAVEAARTAEAAQVHLEQRLKTIAAETANDSVEVQALKGQITTLKGELELAADRRASITRDREDYRTLVEWYFTDVPETGERPFKILSKRLMSREPGDRVVAARLMVLCGPSAKPILRRALADEHHAVREAVETSLVVLDR